MKATVQNTAFTTCRVMQRRRRRPPPLDATSLLGTMPATLRLRPLPQSQQQQCLRQFSSTCSAIPHIFIQPVQFPSNVLSKRTFSTRPIDKEDDGSFLTTEEMNTTWKQHPWTRQQLQDDIVPNLISMLQSSNQRATLNVNYCYDILEGCMQQAKSVTLARQAELLLHALEDAGGSYTPTTPFYDVVLYAYAICGGGRVAAEAAQDLLHHMIDRAAAQSTATKSGSTSSTTTHPTVKTYNIVVHAWAQSGHRDAGWKAEALVESMINKDNGEHTVVTPDVRTIVSLLDAWAKSRHPEAAARALRILGHAVQMATTYSSISATQAASAGTGTTNGSQDDFASAFRLSPRLFHVVLGTLARSPRMDWELAERAQNLLSVMQECAATTCQNNLRPGSRAYATVLECWRRCEESCSDKRQSGAAARQAETLLYAMIDQYRRTGDVLVRPEKVCFATCIGAWAWVAKFHPEEAPERSQALLQTLTGLYHESGDSEFGLRPDIRIYNSVLAVWVRAVGRRDSMEGARACLQELRAKWDSAPDLISYNTILDGWAKRGRGQKAMELLEWLHKVGQKEADLSPDRVSYHSTLSALARDKSTDRPWEKALDLLHRMEAQACQNTGPIPNKANYTIVLGAWRTPERIQLADALDAHALVDSSKRYHRERNWPCLPDNHTYSTLMLVYGKVKGSSPEEMKEALERLSLAMEDCENTVGEASYVSYGSCMKAINQLCWDPAEKRQRLEALFDKCRQDGQVSKQIRISMKIGAWEEGNEPEMQASWCRNVPPFSKPRVVEQ